MSRQNWAKILNIMSRQIPGTWAENLIGIKKELCPGYTEKNFVLKYRKKLCFKIQKKTL
jgi:hypothetical protein